MPSSVRSAEAAATSTRWSFGATATGTSSAASSTSSPGAACRESSTPSRLTSSSKVRGTKITVFYGTIQIFFAPLSEKRFPLSVDAFREGEVAASKAKESPEVCDRDEKEAGGEIEAFCRSGDRVSVGLGRVERAAKSATAGGDAAAVTLTRLDADRSSSRPSFSVSRESGRLQVNFERVSRDDEGAYEVAVADGEGKLEKKFDYTLVVMGKEGCLHSIIR